MGNKITSKKESEMFDAYCIKQSDHYVAKTCGIGRETIAKYRVENKWEERLKKINEKVRAKQDNEIVNVKARHIKVIRDWLNKFTKYLKDKDRTELSASDYEKLVKLELLLLGEKPDEEGDKNLAPVINFISLLSEKDGDGKAFGELWRKVYRERAGSLKGQG